MDLNDIIAIGGKPGLYKIVGQIKNGVLVESLTDKKRFPAHSTHQVSELDNITIYGEDEDLPLKDIFQAIYDKEKGKESISHKSPNEELKTYFKKVTPNYDEDRVYVSDIKKVFNWYNILLKADLLKPEKKEKKGTAKVKKAETTEKKSAKKTKPKAPKAKPVKTAGAKVKVQTIRKTGA